MRGARFRAAGSVVGGVDIAGVLPSTGWFGRHVHFDVSIVALEQGGHSFRCGTGANIAVSSNAHDSLLKHQKPGAEGLTEEISLAHRQLSKQQRTWTKNLKPNETYMLDDDLPRLKEKLMNFYQKG